MSLNADISRRDPSSRVTAKRHAKRHGDADGTCGLRAVCSARRPHSLASLSSFLWNARWHLAWQRRGERRRGGGGRSCAWAVADGVGGGEGKGRLTEAAGG
eukprot:1945763-Rhodomonas_salina.1